MNDEVIRVQQRELTEKTTEKINVIDIIKRKLYGKRAAENIKYKSYFEKIALGTLKCVYLISYQNEYKSIFL